MMRQLLVFIMIIVFGVQGVAQNSVQKNSLKIKIGAYAGYAFYSFENLESLNEQVISQMPFEVTVMDDFPARLFFGGEILIEIADWYSVGPSYEFHSTGSRVGAKDYSGTYHFDQILSTHQLGIENELRILNGIQPAVFINLAGGVNLSSWKMEEELELAEEVQTDDNDFVAVKPFVYPSLKLEYPVYQNIYVFGKAGYLFDVGGKYHLSGNKDYESTLKVPWSSFRISFGLRFGSL
ncbi:hypothetical protein [Maribellus maritimus]|uniref:hypothetical protein n=1 Tax=Maribellus maritimus TaxID=2870838 RepID=UPI001EEAF488|nr:hypothetical protein [Maribellus maritimus]MCG6191083.1 hypothetical protein [Maribellus maritimus]